MTGKTEEERSQRVLDLLKEILDEDEKRIREANAFVFR